MRKTYTAIALATGLSMHLGIAKAQLEDRRQDQINKLKNPCLNIEGSYNDFTRSKEMHTAVIKPDSNMWHNTVERYPAVFYKTLSHGKISYSLSLSTTDSEPAATERGIIIILTNGKRIHKPSAIVRTSVNYQSEFVRSCDFTLTATELAIFKTVSIKEFELYDSQMRVEDGDFIKKMLLCLINIDVAKASL